MGYLGVRIPDDLEQKIKATGRPKSDVVRDALRVYFDVDQPQITKDQEFLVRELDRLLDEKLLVLNTVKQPPLNAVKLEQKPLNVVKQQPLVSNDDLVKKAAQRILDYFNLDQEPTAQQIADDLGVESRPLGRIMAAAGLQAQNVRRGGGRRVRRYTFDMRDSIEYLVGYG